MDCKLRNCICEMSKLTLNECRKDQYLLMCLNYGVKPWIGLFCRLCIFNIYSAWIPPNVICIGILGMVRS